jgi:hypothetical protein
MDNLVGLLVALTVLGTLVFGIFWLSHLEPRCRPVCAPYPVTASFGERCICDTRHEVRELAP